MDAFLAAFSSVAASGPVHISILPYSSSTAAAIDAVIARIDVFVIPSPFSVTVAIESRGSGMEGDLHQCSECQKDNMKVGCNLRGITTGEWAPRPKFKGYGRQDHIAGARRMSASPSAMII